MTDLEYRIAVRAADRCPACLEPDLMPALLPEAVVIVGDDAAATYHCAMHDRSWVTRWSVTALGIEP